MKVLLFGATGMVGQGVLQECLGDPGIESVVAIGRTATGVSDAKFREILRPDLFNYSDIEPELTGFDACFFCLGVSSAGMSQVDYHNLTYTLTLAAAETLARLNPGMTFIYVSGTGTDSSEKGPVMWARVKGRTENALLRLRFKAAYMFRPGIIEPVHGEKSKTDAYRIGYFLAKPFLPLLRGFLPDRVVTTEELAVAMIRVAREGFPKKILESADIGKCARAPGAAPL